MKPAPRLTVWLALAATLLGVACGAPPPSDAGAPASRAAPSHRAGGVAVVQIGPSTLDGQPLGAPDFGRVPPWSHGDVVTILVLGIDRRETEIARSDSIIVSRIDLRNRRVTGVSIPRDLLVEIPGFGIDRVNAAFAFGERQRPGGGPQFARQVIEKSFQVAIGHWIAVDFACFSGAVDAIGGIRLDVPSRLVDAAYPTDDWGFRTVVFEPGPQWLDGTRALQYARTRHADSDFGRMRRQQQVLGALRSQLLAMRNLAALPAVLQSCGGLNSNLQPMEIVALGLAARAIPENAIELKTIDETMTSYAQTAAGASVLVPRWESIRPLIREIVAPAPATARP